MRDYIPAVIMIGASCALYSLSVDKFFVTATYAIGFLDAYITFKIRHIEQENKIRRNKKVEDFKCEYLQEDNICKLIKQKGICHPECVERKSPSSDSMEELKKEFIKRFKCECGANAYAERPHLHGKFDLIHIWEYIDQNCVSRKDHVFLINSLKNVYEQRLAFRGEDN